MSKFGQNKTACDNCGETDNSVRRLVINGRGANYCKTCADALRDPADEN